MDECEACEWCYCAGHPSDKCRQKYTHIEDVEVKSTLLIHEHRADPQSFINRSNGKKARKILKKFEKSLKIRTNWLESFQATEVILIGMENVVDEASYALQRLIVGMDMKFGNAQDTTVMMNIQIQRRKHLSLFCQLRLMILPQTNYIKCS